MTSRLHVAARRYADHGWHIFPCRPGDKIPATAHGCRDATNELGQVDAWWQADPTRNIGLATGAASGVYVIDMDGTDGIEAFLALADEHGGYPLAPRPLMQQTPSGGMHAFYAAPAEIRNSAGKLAESVDVRGDGGYVLLPPSVHPNGGRYRWTVTGEPPAMPGWLLALLRKRPKQAPPPPVSDAERADRYTQAAIDAEIAAVASCGQGSRNDTLYRAAFKIGTLVGAGLADGEHVTGLLEQAAHACGLTAEDGERSVRKTIQSGLSGGVANPRDRSAA